MIADRENQLVIVVITKQLRVCVSLNLLARNALDLFYVYVCVHVKTPTSASLCVLPCAGTSAGREIKIPQTPA